MLASIYKHSRAKIDNLSHANSYRIRHLSSILRLNERDSITGKWLTSYLISRQRRMESVWSELSGAYGLWSDWSQDEKTSNIDKALKVRV